jgi:hypothetical protein
MKKFLRVFLCACGCGEYANPGMKFIKHHHEQIKRKHTAETLKLMSESAYKRKPWVDRLCACGCGEYVEKYRTYRSGHNTRHKPNPRTPEWNAAIAKGVKGRKFSEKGKAAIKKARQRDLTTPEAREKFRKVVTKSWEGADQRRKEMSKRVVENWKDPDIRARIIKAQKKRWEDPELRKKASELHKLRWKNPEFLNKMTIACDIKPNKPELALFQILEHLFPGDWIYTGDYTFWINGKNPDFTHCNGRKLVIELFGDYWHRDDNPEERASIFATSGYRTLVIWERELKNIHSLTTRIKQFIE